MEIGGEFGQCVFFNADHAVNLFAPCDFFYILRTREMDFFHWTSLGMDSVEKLIGFVKDDDAFPGSGCFGEESAV